jgi:lipopolysaccharide biosynthesis regulator YciM
LWRLRACEQARAYFQKSLDIRERLARQEPDRADFQADLVVSLYRLGDRGSLQRALDILQRLDREHKLTAEQRGWIPALEAAARDSGP